MKIPKSIRELANLYLPDHENRLQSWYNEKVKTNGERYMGPMIFTFSQLHFEESLAAFAEQVAKEQREICKREVQYTYINNDKLLFSSYYQVILSAPSPIIKE